MSTPESTEPPIPEASPKVLILAVALGVLALALAVLMAFMDDYKWNRYLSDMKERGEPFTVEELLEHRSPLPDDQNNAPKIQSVLASMRKLDESLSPDLKEEDRETRHDFFIEHQKELPKRLVTRAREYVALRAELLEELRFLHDHPDGRFPFDHSSDPMAPTCEGGCPLDCPSAMRLAAMLRMEGRLRLVDGDIDGAAEDALLILLLSRAFADEPYIISTIFYHRIPILASNIIQESLYSGKMNRDALAMLSGELERRSESTDLALMLAGERANLTRAIELARQGYYDSDPPGQQAPSGANEQENTPSCSAEKLRIVYLIDPLVETADDIPALLKATKAASIKANRSSMAKTLAGKSTLSLAKAIRTVVRSITMLRCVRVALSVEMFTLEHGSPPQSLGELVPDFIPELPVDPINNKPLLYNRNEDGITIYSVWLDGRDDGGDLTTITDGECADLGIFIPPVDQRSIILSNEPENTLD